MEIAGIYLAVYRAKAAGSITAAFKNGIPAEKLYLQQFHQK